MFIPLLLAWHLWCTRSAHSDCGHSCWSVRTVSVCRVWVGNQIMHHIRRKSIYYFLMSYLDLPLIPPTYCVHSIIHVSSMYIITSGFKVTYRSTGPGAIFYNDNTLYYVYTHATIIKHLLTYLLTNWVQPRRVTCARLLVEVFTTRYWKYNINMHRARLRCNMYWRTSFYIQIVSTLQSCQILKCMVSINRVSKHFQIKISKISLLHRCMEYVCVVILIWTASWRRFKRVIAASAFCEQWKGT